MENNADSRAEVVLEFPADVELVKCSRCDRGMLVYLTSFGTRHTEIATVTCWDCLTEEEKQAAIEEHGLDPSTT